MSVNRQRVRPRSYVHRRDRVVRDDAWIRSLLHEAAVGTLATVSDGQPFLNTNLFVYDEPAAAIYLHTASIGRTRTNIEQDERVCFSVSEMGRLLPAEAALDFSVEYAGVVVFGRGAILVEPGAARAALQLLLDKYAPHLRSGRDYRPIVDEELARTTIYCIAIEEWSGKQKVAPPDFPGAFLYQPQCAPASEEEA